MIRSYTEILIAMCDAFDSFIAPKKIKRTDENFIYLLLKAIAKGYEIIHNMANVARNKFNPENSSDADLLSIARIAGTQFLEGKSSGLQINAFNTSAENVATVLAGTYEFKLSDDVSFFFEVQSSVDIAALSDKVFVAFSEDKGSFHVEFISNMVIDAEEGVEIPDGVVFSCEDNGGMLGFPDESTLDFRRRVLTDSNRQDTIKELQIAIRNLPYIFDCNIIFNQTIHDAIVEGITIPPFHLLMVLNGDPRDEIAEVVASRTMYPTVMVDAAHVAKLQSPVFVSGEYDVYYTLFGNETYDVEFVYAYNGMYVRSAEIEAAIRQRMTRFQNVVVHYDFVTEDMFYDAVNEMNLGSFKLLGVNLKQGASTVNHIEIPKTKLPKLDIVTFDARDEL